MQKPLGRPRAVMSLQREDKAAAERGGSSLGRPPTSGPSPRVEAPLRAVSLEAAISPTWTRSSSPGAARRPLRDSVWCFFLSVLVLCLSGRCINLTTHLM